MIAVQISAALTALAGVFFAFYYNNLFPEQIFNIGRSIEIILAPIIGGVGTLFGPILGAARADAAVRRPHRGAGRRSAARSRASSRCSTAWRSACRSCSCRTASGRASRDGWAWRATRRTRANERLAAARRGRRLEELPRPARGGATRRCRCAQGEIVALIGPNGAGKTTLFNLIAGALAPDQRRRSASTGATSPACAPTRSARAGIGRTFQIVKPFADMIGARQRDGRRLSRHRRARASRASAPAPRCAALRIDGAARPAGLEPHAARPQAARGGARARHAAAPAAARRGDGRAAPDRDRRRWCARSSASTREQASPSC